MMKEMEIQLFSTRLGCRVKNKEYSEKSGFVCHFAHSSLVAVRLFLMVFVLCSSLKEGKQTFKQRNPEV